MNVGKNISVIFRCHSRKQKLSILLENVVPFVKRRYISTLYFHFPVPPTHKLALLTYIFILKKEGVEVVAPHPHIPFVWMKEWGWLWAPGLLLLRSSG